MADLEINYGDREVGSASPSSSSSVTANQTASSSSSASGTAIGSSNIGFQLLKKHGWKEGTGLGASQQGRLEPIKTYIKKNKKGLGSEKKRKTSQSSQNSSFAEVGQKEPMSKKEKALTKKQRKMLDEEKRRQEKEFERAFFREFWPDNV